MKPRISRQPHPGTRWTRFFLASLLSSTALAGVAAAQTTSDEIIVTATKRAENIQDVPLSIQALGSQTLDDHQVSSFDDYATLLPSVSYQSFGPSQAQIAFRGVTSGGDGLPIGSSPTASMYLDETPVTTIGATVDLHIYDIARIEALSGPQGTLFGANSLSGVMRVITNQPSPSGFAAGYDVEGNSYTDGEAGGSLEGFVNFPLSDRAALRLVGFYERRGGYIDNIPATRTYTLDDAASDPLDLTNVTIDNAALVADDINDVETYGGRAALGIDLNENWTSTTSVIAQHQESEGPFPFDRRLGDDLQVRDFFPTHNEDRWWMIAETIQGRIGNYDLVYSGSYFDRRIDSEGDYSYYSVYYDTYGSYATYFPDGSGGFLDPSQIFTQREDYTKETHELRINSPADRRFRFTAGLFYQLQTNHDQPNFEIRGIGAAPPASWVSPIPGFGDAIFIRRLNREDVDEAVFGEASYDLTDRMTLTAGMRLFRAEVSVVGFSGFAGAIGSCFGPATAGGPCDNLDLSFEEEGETHRLSLSYDLDDDHMVYATYSTGYRPGGVNRSLVFPPFTSDTISNYEVGFKTQNADHTVRFNGAIFHQTWDDFQFGQSPPGFQGVTFTLNGGLAEVNGVELDFSGRFGDWDLSAAGAYIDATLGREFCNDSTSGPVCTPSGTDLPVQPNWKGTLTARYNFNFSGWESFLQGSLAYQSSTRPYLLDQDVDAVEALLGGRTLPSFATVNFSTGVNFSENTALEFFLHNAFDERGELALVTQCATTYCGPFARSYPSEPRIFGARFTQRY